MPNQHETLEPKVYDIFETAIDLARQHPDKFVAHVSNSGDELSAATMIVDEQSSIKLLVYLDPGSGINSINIYRNGDSIYRLDQISNKDALEMFEQHKCLANDLAVTNPQYCASILKMLTNFTTDEQGNITQYSDLADTTINRTEAYRLITQGKLTLPTLHYGEIRLDQVDRGKFLQVTPK